MKIIKEAGDCSQCGKAIYSAAGFSTSSIATLLVCLTCLHKATSLLRQHQHQAAYNAGERSKYMVRIEHHRIRKGEEHKGPLPYRRGVTEWDPSEKGGYTACYISDGVQLVATDVSVCHPELDSFNYSRGSGIARGRAFAKLGLMADGVTPR